MNLTKQMLKGLKVTRQMGWVNTNKDVRRRARRPDANTLTKAARGATQGHRNKPAKKCDALQCDVSEL